ncbi:NirD/YgiW/YdeI family stress tolerance protein [Aggregatibacter kilianii]|uniref:YgiW/YdeI family stress tolerance OB fold protein n=1 Tax=Aggregatibacter kilianii TaxID=2025884 RepID=UPI0028D03134|nr:NirD/YgiW/YdeI family stress tolerance protein [Aggregatibacter kilianii]
MRKIITLATLLALSSSAFGGFQDTNAGNYITNVQAAKKLSDNAPVTLEGYFIRQIDDDEFIFRDASGEIRIDVENRAWNGVNITPNDRVRIHGSVDKEFAEATTIDVYQLQKIQ